MRKIIAYTILIPSYPFYLLGSFIFNVLEWANNVIKNKR